jgi:hypothetical protein
MKTKKLSKKLSLNRITISNLGNRDLDKARGGSVYTDCIGPCPTEGPTTCGNTICGCYTMEPMNTCWYSCGPPASCNGGPC